MMQDNSKPNLRSKLRLKRDNTNSSQSQSDSNPKTSDENKTEKDGDNCDDQTTPEDIVPLNAEDSLADFKSPKAKTANRPIFSKFQIDAEKVKRKITKSKSRTNISKKKGISSKDQPSIESSFFKPQVPDPQNEVQVSFPCPLCLKPFKDESSCTNHMKTCASKSNVSVRQLLDAKRLQDRQAEERKAMGLPAAPIIPEKKKTNRPRNFSTKEDPQLQLALALSESSYQAEQIEELEQAALLEGIPSECIRHMDEEDRRKTLQNFGFTTNKPIENAPINRNKKRKLLGPTILQTRSKEDKDRVLTERIACILTGDDALTQVKIEDDSDACPKTLVSLRSNLLKSVEQTCNKLWDQSRLTRKHNDFYVKELKYHFLPLVPSDEDGSAITKNDNGSVHSHSLNYSIEYEPVEINLLVNNSEEESNHSFTSTTHLENMKTETDFMKCTIHNWSETLNDSAASDLLILTRSRHIYGHKLVFHVQCPNILLDVETNDGKIQPRIKELISWSDKDHVPALAFLEFIYCGAIIKNTNVFDNEDYLSQINKLARHYKVERLFSYIRMKKREFKSKLMGNKLEQGNSRDSSKEDMLFTKSPTQKCYESKVEGSESSKVQPNTQVNCEAYSTSIQSTSAIRKSVLDNVISNELFPKDYDSRRITASPDLFESESEEDGICSKETQQNSGSQANVSNVNLKILENLIVEEDSDVSIRRQQPSLENMEIEQVGISNSQNTIVNLSESPSPRNHELSPCQEALHEARTPQTARSPQRNTENSEIDDLSLREICDTVTPKSRSPKLTGELHSEIADNEMSEFKYEAITPEACTPTKFDQYVTQRGAHPCTASSPPDMSIDDVSLYTAVTPPKDAVPDQEKDSIHIAVTPPASHSAAFNLSSEENQRSLRSSLDSFINMIQRKNARGPMDSDSDENSVADADRPKKNKTKKNPFSKKYRDDSYRYLRNDGPKQLTNKRVISLLESDELQVNENSKKSGNDETKDSHGIEKNFKADAMNDSFGDFEDKSPESNLQSEPVGINSIEASSPLNTSKYVSSELVRKPMSRSEKSDGSFDEENQTLDLPDDSQISMYSKYKSSNKHGNSIAKYRDKLNFNSVEDSCGQSSNTKETEKSNCGNASLKEDTKSVSVSSTKSKLSPEASDICVISDSDEERVMGATVSPMLRKYSQNTVAKKQNPSKDGKCSTTGSSPESTGSSRRRSQSRKLSLSTRRKRSSPLNSPNDKVWLSKKSESDDIDIVNKNPTRIIDISRDSDEDERESKTSPVRIDSSRMKRKHDYERKVSKRKNTGTPSKSSKDMDEVDDEIDKIFEISLNSESPEKLLENKDVELEKKEGYPIIQCDGINLSPISILSSPEALQEDQNIPKETGPTGESDNADKHMADVNAIEGECFDNLDFNDEWTLSSPLQSKETSQNKQSDNSTSRRRLSFEESIPKTLPVSESVPNELETQSAKIQESSISSLICSPILSQNRRNARAPPSKVSGSETIDGRKTEKLKNRKLMVKSVSASNFPVEKVQRGSCGLQRSSSFVTPEQNKKNRKNQDVTPPVDYSLLETPELQKQLSRFGVKPQNRHNAKLLLRHIYDATHPVIDNISHKRASSPRSSSEDEQPPVKKPNVKGKTVSNQRKRGKKGDAPDPDENRPVIAEEMEYDEADTANVMESPVSIKDAFCRLIESNTELYTKVLTYEPLPLESIHGMLKQNGLKCKINSLMDFLDEQCITFQVQTGKGSRTKRRAK